MKLHNIQTQFAKVLEVRDGDTLLFSTLDDCFGLDRIRDWALLNKLDVTHITGKSTHNQTGE